jgi:hypothetical protein
MARTRRVLADRDYSARAIREHLRRRAITATIPERSDQQAHHRRRAVLVGAARPSIGLPTGAAMWSNAASTGSSSIGPSPLVDKAAISYRGMLDLATLLIWL